MTAPIDWVVLAGYAVAVLAVGATSFRLADDSEAFLLADRSLGTLGVFAATFSTFYGTGIVFTFASFGYLYGVGAFALPVAAVVGFLPLAWAAPGVKAVSDRRDAITLPGLLAGTWRPRTRALAALLTGGLFAAALAANLLVAGRLLEVLLDVPHRAGVVAFGILVVVYTAIGGFRGVVRTDVLQLGVIVASVLLALPAVVLAAAGPGLVAEVPAGYLDPLALPVAIPVAYLLLGAFTFFGSQDVHQRIYAARGPGEARRGLLLFTASLAVLGPVAVGLGIAASAMVPGTGPERVLLALTADSAHTGLLGGLVVGFLALANSDADSQLLTVTSTLTRDLLPSLGVDPEEARAARIDRLGVTGVGTVAIGLAAARPDLVALLSGLGTLLSILGLVVVATLYREGTTDRAAFAGLAVGTVASTVAAVASGRIQPAAVVGLLSTAVAVVVVSILDGGVRSVRSRTAS